MPDQSSKSPDANETEQTPAPALWLQLSFLSRAFWNSPERNKVVLLVAGVVGVIGLPAFGQVRLNAWNRPFYDALARKNFPEFLTQLMAFSVIAGLLLVLNVV